MSESGVPTSYLQSEFIASGRSRDFYKFIKTLSAVRSKPEETDLVNSELQKLSMKMNQPNVTSSTMNEYLIKLIHCALLGYDIDVGIIYAIMATQSGENIAQRRVGYLICTLVLNKQHDLSIMLINTLQRDLKSSNYLDTCAALNALCYLDHLEMVDHLLEPTLKTMESTRQIVRKKGVLALYWFYRRSPLLLDQIEPFLKAALLDKDASVVFVALDIWKKILVDKAEHYQDLLSTIMRIHQQILGRYIHRGYMYHGVLAPWAQITCLQIYGLYQHHGIGSQKDIFGLVITCLRGMENKVDAAYAIILECIKLLSTMDTLLLSTLISDDDTSPFYLLDPFLKANNHTMRYLGLTGLAYVKTTTLWHVDWKDGTLLANIMQSSNDDSVLVKKVIPVLDICVTTEQDLHRIQTALLDSIKQYKDPELVDLVSRWFIGKMDDCVASEWWVETMLRLLASTRTHLDDEFMEIQCHSLKQVLLDEVDDTKLRTKAVNTSYDILSTMSTNDVLAPTCMQILFWILGEHAYLSTKYSELSVMELLQRYILLIQDNPLLQVCNLQAIKRCIMRSKSYLSGLEYILQLEYIKSPIMEKQQASELTDSNK
ncbi:Clathrin/coatomer adaptor, adaptin-like protein [Chlamydoabsidia padenii]|nr:Clathrin/coatomer adaptor, adaptin-like protein [Chlamydoabsidia padenii]